MADIYKGLTVRLGADTTRLSKALAEARQQAVGTQGQLRNIEKALKFSPGNTSLLAQQQVIYQKKIRATTEELDVLRTASEQMGQMRGPLSPSQQEQWTRLQSDVAIAESRLKKFREEQARVAQQLAIGNTTLGQAANAFEAFGDRHSRLGQNLQGIGSTLTRTLTPAMLGIGAASVMAAVDIDSSLTSVRKTVDGTEEQYQQLKEAAIEFSETNAVSASQILDIQALGAQLGFGIEELEHFSEVVSGLDIATDMDAGTAATQLAQFANITQMTHGEISNYGSAIVGLGNNFATTESRISEMAMRIAASGTQVGMSQADILGVATALSSLGVEAEAGGTAISTIMATIDKDVALGSDGMAVWAETARMSSEEFANAWRNDPVQALSAVLTGMESATTEGSNMSLMLEELGISSLRQTDVLKRLAGNSTLMSEAVGAANEEWAANAALTKEVDNRNSSLEARFTMLKNQAIAVGESIGGPLADALLDALGAAKPMIEGIGDAAREFSEMDEGTQRLIIGIVGVVAAAGPLTSLAGKVITNSKEIAGVMRKVAGVLPSVQKETKLVTVAQQEQAVTSQKIASGNTAVATTSRVAAAGTKALSAALKVARLAVPFLALEVLSTVIGTVAGNMAESSQRAQRMEESTIDLTGALEGARDAYAQTGEAAQGSTSGVDSLADSTQEVLDRQRELATELNESWSGVGSNEAALQGFTDTIMRLSGQAQLTAEQQVQLQTAVSGFNEITGQSLAIIDPVTGALSRQKDEILAVKDAYIEQARATAALDALIEIEQQRAMAAERLRVEQEQLAGMDRGIGIGDGFILSDEAYRAYEDQLALVAELEAGVENLNTEYDVANRVLQENGGALAQNAEAVQAVVSANQGVVDVLNTNEQSVQGFSEAIAGLGITQDQLAQMTPEVLSQLAQAWDGSNESIQPILDAYKTSVSEALNQNTRDALAGMNTALQEGTAVTEPQIAALREALLYATKDLGQQAQADVQASMEGIFTALSDGTPLTQAQVDQLNAVLGGVGVAFSPAENVATGVAGAVTAIAGGVAQMAAASEGATAEASAPFNEFGPNATNAAQAGVDGFNTTVAAGVGEAITSGTMLAQGADTGASSVSGEPAGYEYSSGYAQGIRNGTNLVVQAAADMAADALESARRTQDSGSPSKKAMSLGGDYGEGYAIGIKNMQALVARSSATLTDAALRNTRASFDITGAQMSQVSQMQASGSSFGEITAMLALLPRHIATAVANQINGLSVELEGRELGRAVRRVA